MQYQKLLEKARKEADRQRRLDETASKYSVEKGGLMSAPLDMPSVVSSKDKYGAMAQQFMEARKARMQVKEQPSVEQTGQPMMDRPEDGGWTGGTPVEPMKTDSAFEAKLIGSESGGRSNVQIQAKSGGKNQNMTGLYQFSDGRLEEFKKASGLSFTTEQFRNDPALQKKAFDWHIHDIDKAIDNLEGSSGYSRDGLRAVAHLGGKGGMAKFVKSGGKYNPADKFGTHLSDYYNKFA